MSDTWREQALSLQGHVESLEHELGEVRDVLRRIVGHVDSVRHLILPKESEPSELPKVRLPELSQAW